MKLFRINNKKTHSHIENIALLRDYVFYVAMCFFLIIRFCN